MSEAEVRAIGAADQDQVPPAVRADDEQPELTARIVAARVSLRVRIAEIWRARELFVFLVRKDLKVKYKGSVLGFAWSMLNPAVVLLVYYVVFKYFLKNPTPYFALYLFSGLLVWNLFSTALPVSSSVIVANAGIVKKVAFPREILALAQVGTATVFFFFQSIVLVAFLLGFQYAPDWRYLPLVLFGLIDLIVVTAALAVFLSAVNVYLRDVEHLVGVLLQAWFWGVPIIYNYNLVYRLCVRHHLQWLLWLYLIDPITPIVLSFQRALYGHVHLALPGYGHVIAQYSYHFYLAALGVVLVGGIGLLLGAMSVFGRIEGNFAEEL